MKVVILYRDKEGNVRKCFADIDENATTMDRSKEVRRQVECLSPGFITVKAYHRINGTVRGKL